MVPLREAYEKQRQFAADASHELRTPLAVVMASADLLENDPSITSPFLKQVIEDVRDEVKKMAKLVSDLLLVARSDNKALKLKLSRFHAAELLSQTARLMQPLAAKKQIALVNHDCGEACHPGGRAENQAAHAHPRRQRGEVYAGGRRGWMTGFLPAAPGHIRFYVQDNGIGIAPEDQKRIFDRFYRVDKATVARDGRQRARPVDRAWRSSSSIRERSRWTASLARGRASRSSFMRG
jgi:signal transduction histidine kinase